MLAVDLSQLVQTLLFLIFAGLTALVAAVIGPTYDNLLVPELSPGSLFPSLYGSAADPANFLAPAAHFSEFLVANVVDPALALVADYLAYFNEFVGGPRNGYHWLGDSNLDWGQDLKELKRFMVQRGIDRVQLSYFGTADPAHYGIVYEYLPSTKSSLRPSPPLREGETQSRFVALSASQYQGIAFPDKDFYRFYYQYVPNELIGNSILIFDLKALIPRTRAPLPLKLRQLVGLATNAAPIDSCP